MTSPRKGDPFAMRTRMTIIALALVVALAYAAPAIAQSSPQQDAYGGVIAEVVTPSKPKPQQQSAAQQAPVAAAQPSSSALPFTDSRSRSCSSWARRSSAPGWCCVGQPAATS